MTCIVDLQQRWEQLKEIDDGENSSCLVEALLNEVGKLSEKLGDTEMQLEREKDTSGMYHRRFRATDMELKDKQKEMVILPSISHQ
ncbi:hypothetical protein ABVK25_006620 [Lepraria finkii]|uniref:Uncharacterized protein n=1 Tax=Lepraria finkii TaxID=1340010 RepID=A0ABR4B6D7_9LECA